MYIAKWNDFEALVLKLYKSSPEKVNPLSISSDSIDSIDCIDKICC